jgi:hypothetical protein
LAIPTEPSEVVAKSAVDITTREQLERLAENVRRRVRSIYHQRHGLREETVFYLWLLYSYEMQNPKKAFAWKDISEDSHPPLANLTDHLVQVLATQSEKEVSSRVKARLGTRPERLVLFPAKGILIESVVRDLDALTKAAEIQALVEQDPEPRLSPAVPQPDTAFVSFIDNFALNGLPKMMMAMTEKAKTSLRGA